MFYYEIIIISYALKPLTYHSPIKLNLFDAVEVSVKKRIHLGYVYKEVSKPDFLTEKVIKTTNLALSDIQINLLKFISYYYSSELGVSAALFKPFDKNLLCSQTKINHNLVQPPTLNQQQNEALNFALNNNISLIFGDTGCGKSEIYINAIAKILKEDKQILFLMPEISLTPQMKARLEHYFGESIGIWHSKIKEKEKTALLQNFLTNKIRIIAGARSALFLPFTNIGLIIVDEEHDQSYKSDAKPTYNAKNLCIWLAKKFNIKTILGSATPDINTYYKIPFFRIKGTFFEAKKEFIFDHCALKISNILIDELKLILQNNKQAVIFLPTRGNFKMIFCQNCLKSVLCPNCAVSMSVHKKDNCLKCHYCGFCTKILQHCPHCGSNNLYSQKIGTSELKLQLQHILPQAKIEKFDRDEITTLKKLEVLLKNFDDKKIDILIGTQMLSKGHNYHNISLAVILGIDEQLYYPDYMASQKTLSLAIQIAGRAARKGYGKILIQTLREDFFSKYLDDFELFLIDELKQRANLYPPFTKLMRIIISNKSEEKARNLQDKILLEITNIQNLQIIGYGAANIAYIAKKFRFNIFLRANNHIPLLQAGEIALKYGATADIDPLNFN